jgi:putative flippase GtrA
MYPRATSTSEGPNIQLNWWERQPFKWPAALLDWLWLQQRFVKFAIAGALTIPVGLGVLWFLTGVILSTLCWVALQSAWTFRDRKTNTVSIGTGTVIRLTAVGIHTGCVVLFTETFGMWYMTSAVLALGVEFPIAFMLSNKIAWRKRK